MSMFTRLLMLLGLWLATVMSLAAEGSLVAIPPLTGHVVDRAGMLQPAQVETLERRLGQFENQQGSQIIVLIVPTVQPESIEQYSIRVFDAWKIGRKQADDGILIVVAAQDRKLRIDTGYGLEGAIPDAIAKRIVAEQIAPKFRAGDPYEGLNSGIEQIEKLIQGEQLPPVKPSQYSGQGQFGEMLVIGIVAATIVGGVLSMILGRFFGGLATAGVVGVIAWLMTTSMFVMLASAMLVFLYVLVTGGRGGSSFGGWGGGGGWSSGRGSGGWGGGGWGGGGGGSAGGGGASGGW